jgi:predicted RNase H-like HicB family nuclease
MKTIDEYMALPYKIEIMPDADEGGFAARLPELPGCITVGETKEDALANIEDAKRAWLEAAMEDGQSIPEPFSLDDYSGQFKLRIPKSLHRSLAEHAREEGTSMNQYCLYLLSKNDTAEGVNGL